MTARLFDFWQKMYAEWRVAWLVRMAARLFDFCQ
jgi:hypothetical protein